MNIRRFSLVAAAVFVLAGGWIHLREWLDTYKDIPAQVPGSFVVRLGFPVDAAVSLVAAAALVFIAVRVVSPRLALLITASTVAFQVSALVVLIATRYGSVFQWNEAEWTPGAQQSLAVELGAVIMLGLYGLSSFRSDAPISATAAPPVPASA